MHTQIRWILFLYTKGVSSRVLAESRDIIYEACPFFSLMQIFDPTNHWSIVHLPPDESCHFVFVNILNFSSIDIPNLASLPLANVPRPTSSKSLFCQLSHRWTECEASRVAFHAHSIHNTSSALSSFKYSLFRYFLEDRWINFVRTNSVASIYDFGRLEWIFQFLVFSSIQKF